MQAVLVFDIETVPDLDAARRVYEFDGLSDQDVLQAINLHRRVEANTEFQKHFMHQIVAISAVMATSSGVKIWSLGEETSSEKELIERFFEGIEKFQPTLVSWNGSGFDLPVLHYRALLHGVTARSYWDMGDFNRERKWNNYISRYQFAHLDLMDVMAAYQPRAFAKLDEIAQFLGLPGKMGLSGAMVLEQFQNGDLKGIRDYCELDVINTYLVFLRFQLMRGWLTEPQYQQACEQLRKVLDNPQHPHWQAYNQAWL